MGNRVCDCHDMFSTCHGNDRRRRDTHHTPRKTKLSLWDFFHPKEPPLFCHCEERSDAAVSFTITHTLCLCSYICTYSIFYVNVMKKRVRATEYVIATTCFQHVSQWQREKAIFLLKKLLKYNMILPLFKCS